jgi:hypothetical protein
MGLLIPHFLMCFPPMIGFNVLFKYVKEIQCLIFIKNKYRPLTFIMAIHKVHNHGLKKNPIMKFNYKFQFL